MARSAEAFVADTAAANVAVSDLANARGAPASAPCDDKPTTISEVARAFGITVRALRFYEAKRLIAPQRHGAVRLYGRRDRERIQLILTGRRLGFTLAEIGQLLARPDGRSLKLTREQCVSQITLLESHKRDLDLAIAELRQIYTSFYQQRLAAGQPLRGE